MLVFASYLFYFIAASASPIQRRWLATREDADSKSQIAFSFQVTFVIVVLSLLLPIFQPIYFHGTFFQLAGLTLLCGIFGAGFFVSSYISQKHVEAGITTLVSNVYTPVTIALATIFLNEKLTPIQIIGAALLLVGVLVVSKKHRTGKFAFDKYFLLMLASGVMLGVCLTAERALQKTTGFTAGTMLNWWAQCAVLGVVMLLTHSKSTYVKKDITITGILRFFQQLSWVILIFVVGNLSLVSAITTFKVVVIFIAAAVFLKEREDFWIKLLGSIIAVGGLLLMK